MTDRMYPLLFLLLLLHFPSPSSCCGGSLSAPVGEFTSPSHPSAYANGLTCEWLINVAPGFKIEFSYLAWELEVRAYYGNTLLCYCFCSLCFCGCCIAALPATSARLLLLLLLLLLLVILLHLSMLLLLPKHLGFFPLSFTSLNINFLSLQNHLLFRALLPPARSTTWRSATASPPPPRS